MNTPIEYPLIILVSCLISACFTFIVLRWNNKIASETIEIRQNSIIEEIQTLLDTELEQFRPLISRAMSIAGNAGVQARKVQAFEREAIRAIQDDLPITPEMIRSFSPKLGDMVDENPELLLKGRGILQKILGDGQGFNLNGAKERDFTWVHDE